MLYSWRRMMLLSLLLFAASELNLDLGEGHTLPLLRIDSGTFMQGSPTSEAGRETDEGQRQVTVSKAFYIGKYPVRVRDFQRFVEDTGYRSEAEKGQSGGFGEVG